MSKNVRDKTQELYEKWSYLKALAKDDKLDYERNSEIYAIEDEIYKKYLFYKKFLNAEEKIKDNKGRKIK